MRNRLVHLMVLCVMLLGASRPLAASNIALTFIPDISGLPDTTRGWLFTTAVAITVTDLGWWDEGENGLVDSHDVAIWDTAGILILSGTVSASTADPILSSFRFTSALTGTPLLPAGTYVIAGLATPADPSDASFFGGTLTLAPGITFIENRFDGTVGVFSFPADMTATIHEGVFGPTFQFDVVAAPEPSDLMLFGAGAIGIALLSWRHRVSTGLATTFQGRSADTNTYSSERPPH